MANELQVRYSNIVDAKLRAELIFKNGITCNNKFEGSPKAGAVKIPVRDTEAVVGTYDKANGGSLNASNTSYLTVTMDTDLYVNELIDGYDAEAVPDNIVADRLDSAGYSLGLAFQAKAFEELEATATKAKSTTATTKDSAYANLVEARTALSTAKVPTNGRVAIVSPAYYGLLLQDSNFIKQSDLSQEMVKAGAVGMCAGFTIFEGVGMNAKTEFIAYHPTWFTEIEEWAVPVHVQDLSASGKYIGASAVQGRKVMKYKLTKAEAAYLKQTA